jgi:hypothetical protein
VSSGRDGKEEVMIQMFIGEPMSNVKAQSSNETQGTKSNFLTFGF